MILLDTHVVVWLQQDPHRLSSPATGAIRRSVAGGRLAVAAITQWELARLGHSGRVALKVPLREWLGGLMTGMNILPLSTEVAVLAAQLGSRYPADPVDRIIGATALVHGLTLVTADERIRASGMVRTLW